MRLKNAWLSGWLRRAMHDGWRTVRIGDVVARSDERLGRSAEPTILTCTEGAGLIRQADKFKKRIAAADTSLYKVVRRGDVVYNPYLLWKGAIAQSDFDEMCITSPVYEVLRPLKGVDTRYIGLALTSRGVVRQFDALSIGSIERRRRAVLPAVLDVPVDLPPLAEQRRIVDLNDAFDAAARASSGEVRALRLAHRMVREQMLSAADEMVTIDDLIEGIEAGRSPDGVDRQPEDGEASVLKVSAVRPGWFDRTQVKVVTDTSIFPEHARVVDGDLLITRANTRELVGSVCLVEDPYPNSFLCDKTLRLVPNKAVTSAEYLHEVLQSGESRRQLSDAATGTSASMKNISQSSIRGIRVPLLSRKQQSTLAKVASSLREATIRAEALVASTEKVRKATVTALLVGNLTIPSTYDRFLAA